MSSKVAKFEEYARKQKEKKRKIDQMDRLRKELCEEKKEMLNNFQNCKVVPCDLCEYTSTVWSENRAYCLKHWTEKETYNEILKPYIDKIDKLTEKTNKYKSKYKELRAEVVKERLVDLGLLE